MTPLVLGLDIGGANLKAATVDKRAVSVPFALWKQPDKLPAALADLVGQFPDAEELAVTMTGELCDCYETKREGVNAILDAVESVAKGRQVRVWSTDGAFVGVEESRSDYMKVAAANWHALATFAGRYARKGGALLIDIGSTTTDIIPILDGRPISTGKTDVERLRSGELVYTGVGRTPVCALLGKSVAAEVFATTRDAYLILEWQSERPEDLDTADGRTATLKNASARMSRMLCGDPETISADEIRRLAERVLAVQREIVEEAAVRVAGLVPGRVRVAITCGRGEPVATAVLGCPMFDGLERLSLNDILGPTVSACAPAYALAVLATERRP